MNSPELNHGDFVKSLWWADIGGALWRRWPAFGILVLIPSLFFWVPSVIFISLVFGKGVRE